MSAVDERYHIVKEIIKRHPAMGVERGWSWYIGGMRDTGAWYVDKMLEVPAFELQAFLTAIVTEENKPPRPHTEEELADMKKFITIESIDKNGKSSFMGVISEYQRKQIEQWGNEIGRKYWFGE